MSFSAVAALLLAFVFWVLRKYTTVDIDAEGVAIITALVAAVVGYLTPLSEGEVDQIVQSPSAPLQLATPPEPVKL